MVLTIVACNNGRAERDTGIAVLAICLFGRCFVDIALVHFREGFARTALILFLDDGTMMVLETDFYHGRNVVVQMEWARRR